jgi:hypothetical protein
MQTPEAWEKSDIDKYLESIGAYVIKPFTMGYGPSGHSDRAACIDGRFWGIEVKREGKEPTALQARRMREIEEAGGLAVAGTAEKVIGVIEAWRRNA